MRVRVGLGMRVGVAVGVGVNVGKGVFVISAVAVGRRVGVAVVGDRVGVQVAGKELKPGLTTVWVGVITSKADTRSPSWKRKYKKTPAVYRKRTMITPISAFSTLLILTHVGETIDNRLEDDKVLSSYPGLNFTSITIIGLTNRL